MQKTGKQHLVSLFTEHRERLHLYLRSRLANDADAQELAQEAYLRLLRISRTVLIKHPQTYLYRIASNLINDLYGRQLTPDQQVGEEVLNNLESSELSPEQCLERRRQLQQIEQALSELPPKCRAVVTLRGRQGMTSLEVAERLGISTNTVKKYMTRGVAHCRKRIRWSMDET